MATKKVLKKIGMFSIETAQDKMVSLHNNCKMMLTMDPKNPERVKSVRYVNHLGQEFTMPTEYLVQAAKVAREIDRSCEFVCGFHGSFIAPPTMRQVPGCPHCHTATINSSVTMMNSTGTYEENDA